MVTAFGRRLRYERSKRGWTLNQMARNAGLSQKAIVNIEQGRQRPSVATMGKIAKALDIELCKMATINEINVKA